MAELSQPRSCGKHLVPEIGHEIEIYAKKGENCDQAVARVYAKWKAKGPKGGKRPSGASGDKDEAATMAGSESQS
jgi:hypothetical protein